MTGFSNTGKASGFAGVDNNGYPSGDLTGSYPNPLVKGLWNYPIDGRVPANGETLVFNGGEWIPTPSPSNTAALFKGVWNATTNVPDIANYPGLSDGFTWLVQVAGNTTVGGIGDWHIGDYAIYTGGSWYKLSNSSFGWGLTGNAGTISTVNYVGTNDPHELSIRANAVEGLKIEIDGNVTAAQGVTVTKALKALIGLSGSLTKLSDGTSAFIADTGVLITSASNGAVTFKVDDSKFASLTGSVFSGPVSFTSGLSGSLTKLSNGTSAFIAGTGILVSSASNGAVTFTMSNTGSAGTYGTASQVPVFSTDAQGRVTSATNTSIAIDGSQITTGNISVPIVPLRLGSSGIQSITSTTTQITPTGTYHRITNTTGGNITLTNAQASINWPGATVGQVLIVQMVVVPGLKNVVLTRGATTKLALDGATVTLSPGASATFIYDGNLWVETAFMNGTSAP